MLPEQLLVHDAFVRSLARHLVGEAADDLAQQTWVAALEHPPRHATSLKAWLAAIVRNLAWKRRRGEERRARHERAAAPQDPVPATAEVLAQEETRRRLVAAVLALEEPARSTMLLRYFRQMPPRAIADHFGVPVETVRTRIKRSLERLRGELDREHGGNGGAPTARSSWVAALVPLTRVPPLGPVAATSAAITTLGAGVLAMSMKAKLVGTIVVIASVTAGVVWWRESLASSSATTRANATESAARPELASAESRSEPTPAVEREVERAPERAAAEPSAASLARATGSVLVHAKWRDGSAAAAIGVILESSASPQPGALAVEQATAPDGTCRFESVAPGAAALIVDRGGYARVEVKPGEEVDAELWVNSGIDLSGEVVDGTGHAVRDATITLWDGRGSFGHDVGRSDAQGRFAIRSIEMPKLVSARAARFAPAPFRYVNDDGRGSAQLQLVLARKGGAVTGRVVGPDRKPVARALVQLGDERRLVPTSTRGDMNAIPFLMHERTDGDGRFAFDGTLTGEVPIVVRSGDFAPWQSSVAIAPEATTEVEVELLAGATLTGRVVAATGEPARGAWVRVGSGDSCAASRTQAAADGSYRLDHLAPGPFDAVAASEADGRARTSLAAVDGAALRWDAKLEPGPTLRGRVLDEEEHPVPDCRIMAFVFGGEPGEPTVRSTTTDEAGWFELTGCSDRPYQVNVQPSGQGFTAQQAFQDVRAGGEDLIVHVSHAQKASAFVEGIVADADGHPIAGANVFPFPRIETGGIGIASTSDGDGRFRAGPLAPGMYDVTVRATGRVPFATSPFELHADEHRDLGTLRLPRGGTLRASLARDDGGSVDGIELEALAGDRSAIETVRVEGGVATATLKVGSWELRSVGGGCAPAVTRFDVREGEETKLELELVSAPEAVLVIAGLDAVMAARPRSTPYAFVRLVDARGQELINRGLPAFADRRPEWRVCLAPGRYALEVLDRGDLLAQASFEVLEKSDGGDLLLTLN